MKKYRMLLFLVWMLPFVSLPAADAELIWGEIRKIDSETRSLQVLHYNANVGIVETVELKMPQDGFQEAVLPLDSLNVGDEILVEAVPVPEQEAWLIHQVNVGA